MNKKLKIVLGVLAIGSLTSCAFFDSLSSYTKPANLKNVYENLGLTRLASTGNQKILVIPVDFDDYTSSKSPVDIDDIYQGFFGEAQEDGWESVASYYKKSSYNKLNITGIVTDWFRCSINANSLGNVRTYKDGTAIEDPTWYVLREAVEWVRSNAATNGIDLDDYDVDNDGNIDAVHLVYSVPTKYNSIHVHNTDSLLYWAYTYWDYTPAGTSSKPVGSSYAWCSAHFFAEGNYRDSDGKLLPDAHTFIHETGHLLGLVDYYSYDDHGYGPLGELDMMDYNIGDHNSYSKYLLGWTSPTQIDLGGEVSKEYTLTPFESTGKSLIIKPDWNGSPYDEYYIIEFYTPTGLNELDSQTAYSGGPKMFTKPGIKILHINSKLGTIKYDYTEPTPTYQILGFTNKVVYKQQGNFITFTDVLYSNSPITRGYISTAVLAELVEPSGSVSFDTTDFNGDNKCATNDTLFTEGMSFPSNTLSKWNRYDDGTTVPFTVTVDSITDSEAKITVTNRN